MSRRLLPPLLRKSPSRKWRCSSRSRRRGRSSKVPEAEIGAVEPASPASEREAASAPEPLEPVEVVPWAEAESPRSRTTQQALHRPKNLRSKSPMYPRKSIRRRLSPTWPGRSPPAGGASSTRNSHSGGAAGHVGERRVDRAATARADPPPQSPSPSRPRRSRTSPEERRPIRPTPSVEARRSRLSSRCARYRDRRERRLRRAFHAACRTGAAGCGKTYRQGRARSTGSGEPATEQPEVLPTAPVSPEPPADMASGASVEPLPPVAQPLLPKVDSPASEPDTALAAPSEPAPAAEAPKKFQQRNLPCLSLRRSPSRLSRSRPSSRRFRPSLRSRRSPKPSPMRHRARRLPSLWLRSRSLNPKSWRVSRLHPNRS